MDFFGKRSLPRRRPPGEEETDSARLINTPSQRIYVLFASQAYPALCVAACALTVALTARGGPLFPKRINIDSGVFRYVGKVILSGGMPYRDTFDHKGPLLYLIQALGLSLGAQGIWLLEVLALLVAFLYLYKIARLLGCGKGASCANLFCGACALSLCFEGGNLTEEYALPFLSVSLHIFLRYFIEGKVERRNLMVCGASCAAVALLRINMAGLWVAMGLGVIADCAQKKRIREIGRCALWFLFGFLALALPVLLWLCLNGAFEDFIQDYFLFNFGYVSGATDRASVKNKLKAIYALTAKPLNLLPAATLFYVCAAKKRLPDILCFASIALDIVLLCLSGQTYAHYEMVLLPLNAYAFARLFMEFGEMKRPFRRRLAVLTVALVCFVLVFEPLRKIFSGEAADSALLQVAQIVRNNSEEGDFITVCGNRDSIYLFADRQSVSKYSYQRPVCFIQGHKKSMEMREEYFEDVQTRKPKIIVLLADYPGYDRIKEIADKNYRPLETVGDNEIYVLTES